MSEIRTLLEALRDGNGTPPVDLLQRIQSDSVRTGLERIAGTLEYCASDIGDGKLGFQEWSETEMKAVSTILKFVLSSMVSLRVERAVSLVCRVYKLSVEISTCLLYKYAFSNSSLKFQKTVLQCLEISLFDGTDKEFSVCPFNVVEALVDMLPVVSATSKRERFKSHVTCSLEGDIDCLKKKDAITTFMATVVSQSSQGGHQTSQSVDSIKCLDPYSLFYIVKHWAVVHVRCVHRLAALCNELLKLQLNEGQYEDLPTLSKLSLLLRIFRLLANLVMEVPLVRYDMELLQEITVFANSMSGLFQTKVEILSIGHPALENNIEHLLVLLLEEFFHFIQVLYSDCNVFQNIQSCVVGSLLDILEAKVWRFDKVSVDQKPQFLYSPRIAIYIVKLLGKLKGSPHDIQNLRDYCPVDLDYSSGSEVGRCMLCIRSKNVSTLETYTHGQVFDMMFPASGNCLDNLVHLASYLYTEGLKSRPTDSLEETNVGPTDVDNAVSNEDEALFGDLFSAVGRQVGMPQMHNQPSIVAGSVSNTFSLPLQAVIELLSFLKDFILSPQWNHAVPENVYPNLNGNHMSLLISILFVELEQADGKENALVSAFQKQIEKVREVCFDLLLNLMNHHALCDPLQEHLVDEVLKVHDGIFVYNTYTLTLLAHVLVLCMDSFGMHLRRKIYDGYIKFVLDKVKLSCSKSICLKEVSLSMPCMYHEEILLMAFHLSEKAEKITLAKLVLDGVKTIDDPPTQFGGSQISTWSLIVSRLLLVLRHMIFYCGDSGLDRIQTRTATQFNHKEN